MNASLLKSSVFAASLVALAAVPARAGLPPLGGEASQKIPDRPAQAAAPVKIKRVFLRFQSGEFYPTPQFNLHVYVYPGTQRKVESNERGGSILGYESRDRPIPIASGSVSEIPLQGYSGMDGVAGVPATLDKETFSRLHGGHFRMNFYWKSSGPALWVGNPELVLEYEDGSVQRIAFPRFKDEPGSGAVDYYFDDQFRVIQP